MLEMRLMRDAVRAYPNHALADRKTVRKMRVAYIRARLHLGDRALLAGGAWKRSATVLVKRAEENRDAVVATVCIGLLPFAPLMGGL